MKQVFFIAAFFGVVVAMYFLYQRQLGAISFFIMSIFFFYLAFHQLSKARKRQQDDSIK